MCGVNFGVTTHTFGKGFETKIDFSGVSGDDTRFLRTEKKFENRFLPLVPSVMEALASSVLRKVVNIQTSPTGR